MQASEKFTYDQTCVTSSRRSPSRKLEPGKVYFLNTQQADEELAAHPRARSKRRQTCCRDDDAVTPSRTCRGGRSGRRSPTRSTTTT